jgi:hypothetical protein
VHPIDITDAIENSDTFSKALAQSDIVHIQYEPSLFFVQKSDAFLKLTKRLHKPLFVSLHEVYDQFPGIFPRKSITGKGLIPSLKKILWDIRHPLQRAMARHEKFAYNAGTIFVHWKFQKEILAQKGIDTKKIVILEHPVADDTSFLLTKGTSINTASSHLPVSDSTKATPLSLASLGFVNLNYDYHLLLETLASLNRPWRFTWIGGTRREEDEPLINWLRTDIIKRHWQDKFIITGWVEDAVRDSLLNASDLILALFISRSSSESLATIISHHKPIIATSLPLTEELKSRFNVLHTVKSEQSDLVNAIHTLADTISLQQDMIAAQKTYCNSESFNSQAQRLTNFYTQAISL